MVQQHQDRHALILSESSDSEVNVFAQSVEDYDSEELQKMRNDLKIFGETFWGEIIAFIEKRLPDANQRINLKHEIVRRV